MPRVLLLFLAVLAVAAAWVSQGPAQPDATHSITLAVHAKANSASTCDSVLSLVSDPDSPHYGNHKSLAEVNSLFLDYERVARVEQWLSEQGYAFTTVGDYVKVTDSIEVLNEMLDANFHSYVHPTMKGVFFNTEQHSVPAAISDDVELVLNVSLPTMQRTVSSFRVKAKPLSGGIDGSVTPALLKALYRIGNRTVTLATQGVFASQNEDFSADDLVSFQKQQNLPLVPVKRTGSRKYDGKPTAEASMDVQYMAGTAWSQNTYFSYYGGTDYTQWAIDMSQMPHPPQVNSISYYTTTRSSRPDSSKSRFNLEACKLGLRGVTFVSASGDDGANYKRTCDMVTQFPAESPYVTTVGATQGPESGKPEVAVTAYASGGGFSWLFNRPSYQQTAVEDWFRRTTDLPSRTPYNREGRGYPDVSLLGVAFRMVVGGRQTHAYGTSVSAPTFAAMLTLVNEQLLLKGRPTVGFVNPALYKAPAGVFNDITVGRNNVEPKCEGYSTTRGWDPVTGLGTPNVDKLIDYFVHGINPGGNPTQAPTHAPTQAPTHAPTRQTNPPTPTHTPVNPTKPSNPSGCDCVPSQDLSNLQQTVDDLSDKIATMQDALKQLSGAPLKSVLKDVLNRLD